ncbi:MAG: GTPase Era [Armatimonadota bacterium]|nr:GTPase Era [Armatimonadota bacterium]MDW8155208.1 GTPase Era [Armatimonadota bacterium]
MTEGTTAVVQPTGPQQGMPGHRSGFVALFGPPNSGKSTLLNALVGAKVAITTPVPQTTRSPLRGILTLPHAQVVFVDTPGLHRPRHKLGEQMVREARKALEDVDVALLVLDASRTPGEEAEEAAQAARGVRVPLLVALNKRDVATEEDMGTWERWLAQRLHPEEVLRTSALRGDGLDGLVEALVRRLPEGPPYFTADDLTDQPVQALVREIIREKAMELTREEVPHAIAVELEEFRKAEEGGVTYIRATLHVERPSQKKILVGAGGRVIREIGRRARPEVEAWVGGPVYLDLWVKVTEDWRRKEGFLRRLYPQR